MKKILLCFILLFPMSIKAIEYPNLNYYSAIIYDNTDDRILYELNSEEQKSIASLTKILTTITALEEIDNLDDKVVFTKEMKQEIRNDASLAHLIVGHEYTYKDLLIASILPSGADATTALAISLNGDIPSFVDKMNEKKNEIGLNNSHFSNVIGLDDINHYSTAEDVLKLLKYALNNKTFKEIYLMKEYTLSDGLKVVSTTKKMGEKINLDTSKILGSKTGFTLDSEYCITAYFNIKDHEILLVTLDTPHNANMNHIKDTITLIDFLENNYQNNKVLSEDEIIDRIPVVLGKNYMIKPSEDKYLLLENDANIKIEYTGKKKLTLLDHKKEIGTIKVYNNNILIYEEQIIAENIKIDYMQIYLIFQYLVLIIFAIMRLKYNRVGE